MYDAAAVRSVALFLPRKNKNWLDTPSTFCGIFGSRKMLGMWSLYHNNKFCMFSFTCQFLAKNNREARTHTQTRISNGVRSFIHKCENESEVAARLSVWVWVWVWVEIIENADRQPSQLLSAINSILYDHQGEPRNSSIVANTIKHVCSLFSLSLSLYIYIYSSV